jgi:hypothetical protein
MDTPTAGSGFIVMRFTKLILSTALLLLPVSALEAKSLDNRFASILVDGKKIGTVHFAVTSSDNGELEVLRTRASYSVLGITVYSFTQDLQELWKDGELQSVTGKTDDDGTTYDFDLKRMADGYEGTLNDKPVKLPLNAFPASLWHYAITQQDLLFQLSDLRLTKVSVKESKVSKDQDGKTVELDRFDFTGEWSASIWFDEDKIIEQAKYKSEGKTVKIVLDP